MELAQARTPRDPVRRAAPSIGEDYCNGATDTISSRIRGSIDVINRSKGRGRPTISHCREHPILQAEHGASSGHLGAAAHRLVQRDAGAGNFPRRRRDRATFTGPTAEAIEFSNLERHRRFGLDDVGADAGSAGGMRNHPSRAHADAQAIATGYAASAISTNSRQGALLIRSAEKFVNGAGLAQLGAGAGRRLRRRAGAGNTLPDCDYLRPVGAGVNGLVAASILCKKGRKVIVLERNDRVGGCLRSEEITAPGFVHDVMATTLVLFLTSPAYGAIGKDLEARGFAVAHSDLPTGVLRPDGSHLLFSRDRARNVAAFEACASGDGAAFAEEMDAWARTRPSCFRSRRPTLVAGDGDADRARGLAARAAHVAGLVRRGPEPFAHLSRNHLPIRPLHALWAPWGLHCGLNPESAYSAAMVKLIAFAVELAGCPIAMGGRARCWPRSNASFETTAAKFAAAPRSIA